MQTAVIFFFNYQMPGIFFLHTFEELVDDDEF